MLGAYQVLQKLGEGGMGEVLLGLAPDRALVVLKMPLRPSPETTARLRDEARVGFRLRHPNIVRTRDFFMVGQKPVLVIDYVDGASLKDVREQRGPMSPAAVAHVGRQVASALSFVHRATDEQGQPLHMLHRDVTPGNILLNRRGDALLIDLGIARSDENTAGQTATGILKGTFRYLCPELFMGAPYSPGTDLWALGVTLFESAMGRKAAVGGQQAVLAAILGGRIMELRPGEQLHPLLHKTFQALLRIDDPARRITDAAQLERVFASLAEKLGDGAAEAELMMRVQPQGDVSGEFGADDMVPSVYDGQLGASAAPPASAPAAAGPLPSLSIPIVVVDEAIELSSFDLPRSPPALSTALSSADAPPTVAITAGQVPSEYAPPTVALSIDALPSRIAAPTLQFPAAPHPIAPVSDDAPLTMMAMAAPSPVRVAPAPVIGIADDDPPRE